LQRRTNALNLNGISVMESKKKPLDFSPLVNHRLIVKPNPRLGRDDNYEREYSLTEISPNGSRLKFRNVRGGVFWCPTEEYVVVEDLGEDKPR
jgi:hypothetical protein